MVHAATIFAGTIITTCLFDIVVSITNVGCKEKGVYVSDPSPLLKTKSRSAVDCYGRCARDGLCNSVNFNTKTKMCTLSKLAVGSAAVTFVRDADFVHVSIYSCSVEKFWRQASLAGDCGGSILFSRYGNRCFHAYDLLNGNLNTMASRCQAWAAEPAKLEDVNVQEHVMNWMLQRKNVGRINWGFVGATRHTACPPPVWFWMVDSSPVTWHNLYNGLPYASTCYDAMIIHDLGSSPAFTTSPNIILCEKAC